MHAEAFGGGVAQFDAAVETRACPYLNQLGETALGEMRSVYEQVEAGNFDALGDLAERLATAVEQKTSEDSSTATDPTTTPVEAFTKPKPEPTEEIIVEAKIEDVLAARVSEAPDVVPSIGLVKEKAEPVVADPLFVAAERVAPVVQAETSIKPAVKEMPLVSNIAEVVQTKVEPVLLPPAVVAEIVAHDRVEATGVLPITAGDEVLVEVKTAVASVSVPEQADERDFRVEELFMLADLPAADRPVNTVDTSPFPGALTYSDEELLVVYDAEVVETYRELEAFIAEAEETPVAVQTTDFDTMELPAADGIIVPDYPPADLAAPIEPLVRPSFQTFVAEQPAPPEPVTFQAVQEHAADEQPLEQVLAEVAVLLSDSVVPERRGYEEQTAVLSVLQEIADMLPTCYIVTETGEPQVRITPEMTKNLLNLLQSLGYEQPRQVLVEFVKDNGLVYLLEAVDYLSSLARDEKYNPEFAKVAPILLFTADDEYPALRLRRALFDLIARERIPV